MSENLGARLARLEAELSALRSSQRISHTSIENSAVNVYDGGGSLRAVVGQQADGTTALNVTNGPPPPLPTAPTVEPILAALAVVWNGQWQSGGVTPLDWARVEVHVSGSAGFTPSQATLVNTVETPQGGSVVVPLPYTAHYVRLRARTTAGVAGPATSAVAGTPRRAEHQDIDADAINGRTITGSLLRTGQSGPRIEITPDAFGSGLPGILVYTSAIEDDGPAVILGEDGTFRISSALMAAAPGKTSKFNLNADNVELTSNHITWNVGDSGEASLWVPVGPDNLLDGTFYHFGPRGCTVGPWFDVEFSAGWANYGSGHQPVQYRQMPDGTVMLRGRGKPTAGATSGTMFVLPEYVRPAAAETFAASTPNNVNANVLVQASGAVDLVSASGGLGGWVSFGSAFWEPVVPA